MFGYFDGFYCVVQLQVQNIHYADLAHLKSSTKRLRLC